MRLSDLRSWSVPVPSSPAARSPFLCAGGVLWLCGCRAAWATLGLVGMEIGPSGAASPPLEQRYSPPAPSTEDAHVRGGWCHCVVLLEFLSIFNLKHGSWVVGKEGGGGQEGGAGRCLWSGWCSELMGLVPSIFHCTEASLHCRLSVPALPVLALPVANLFSWL